MLEWWYLNKKVQCMELNVTILNSESHKLLLSVNLLDVPLPYIMASQENHQAGACYQLPVLDEK